MNNVALANPDVEPLAHPQARTITAVWLALIIATCLSWWLGADHGLGDANSLSSVIILITASIKIRFVGIYFMELRDAPASLRIIFETYCVGVCALIIAMYLGA